MTKRRQVFASFKSIFLRNRSMSNAGWFCAKNTKLRRDIIMYLNKIDWVETKFSVRRIITIIWATCVKKNSQYLNFNEATIGKISIFFFKKLPQISHIHKHFNFFKYNWNCLDHLLLPFNFMAVTLEEYSFSILPVVSS